MAVALDPAHPEDDTLNWLAVALQQSKKEQYDGKLCLTIDSKRGTIISAELTRSERRHTARA